MGLRTIASAVIASALFVGSATAATTTIDFTNNAAFPQGAFTSVSGNVGSTTFLATATGGKLRFTELGSVGTTCASILGLKCDQDGVGVNDDEITAPSVRAAESITISFGKAVTIGTLFFLDLFRNEAATVSTSAGDLFTVAAPSPLNNSGAKKVDVRLSGVTSITFSAANPPSGDDATNDYALAGVSLVPLPAGMLLMLTGLGGLGFAGRRRLMGTVA